MDKYGLKNCGAYMQWDFIQLLKSFLKEDADICNNMDNLEDLRVNEINQTQKDKFGVISLRCRLLKSKVKHSCSQCPRACTAILI